MDIVNRYLENQSNKTNNNKDDNEPFTGNKTKSFSDNKFEGNKLVFLNKIYKENSSRLTIYRYLNMFSDLENIKDKDIALFNKEEIKSALNSIPSFSRNTKQTIRSMLYKYLVFACDRKINPTGINPMDGMEFEDDENIDIEVLRQKFITKEEMYKICEIALKNDYITYQYLASFVPLFYGITVDEVINMRYKDINHENKTIQVFNDDGEIRDVQIDDKLIHILSEAEDEYELPRNSKTGRELVPFKLQDIGYIIKVNKLSQIKPMAMRQRFQRVIDAFNDFIGYTECRVTIGSLHKSGKIERCKELENELGRRLSRLDYRQVQEEFNDNPDSYAILKADYEIIMGYEKIDDRQYNGSYERNSNSNDDNNND